MANRWMTFAHLREIFRGPVGGVRIADQHLVCRTVEILCQERRNDVRERLQPIVRGHDDRDLGHWRTSSMLATPLTTSSPKRASDSASSRAGFRTSTCGTP